MTRVPATNRDPLAPYICGNVAGHQWARHPGWRKYIRRPLLEQIACGGQLRAYAHQQRLYCPACMQRVAPSPPGRMPWTLEIAAARVWYWRRIPK